MSVLSEGLYSRDDCTGAGGDFGLAVKQVNFEFAAQAFESGEMLLLLHFASLNLRL